MKKVHELLEEPQVQEFLSKGLVEVYQAKHNNYTKLHTDFIDYVELNEAQDLDVLSYQILDEQDYNYTIQANTDSADFEEWYGDKDTKVLCILATHPQYE